MGERSVEKTVTMMAGTPSKSTTARHPQVALSAEEPLTARARIGPALIGLANGSVDQIEVGDRGMFLEDLRVDESGENHLDAIRRASAQHDLHARACSPARRTLADECWTWHGNTSGPRLDPITGS